MEIELVEIRDFVAQHHPFDVLPIESLDEITRNLQVRYLRRNQPFPPEHDHGESLYIIRTGAIELRDAEGGLVGRLAEGDLYSSECNLVNVHQDAQHHAIEDTLFYLLPCHHVKRLCRQSDEFNQFFSESTRDRLKQAVGYNNQNFDTGLASLTVEVQEIINRKPVCANASTSIQDIAKLMSEHDVSSILLTREKHLTGVVTDSDLRNRCIAQGLDLQSPVSEIMSENPETIDKNSLVLNAMMQMTRQHFHHLPVMDGDQIIGMLSATDLTRHSGSNPALMTSEIRKAKSLDDLVYISKKLPDLQFTLASSNISAKHIGETISCITNALTIRLIQLVQEEIGPEPVPFAWVAGGSQARLEQTSHSDQDNAIILSDDVTEEQIPYFLKLAKRVSDGLNSCGFVYCPGNAMASNPQWCQPLSKWRTYFEEWIRKTEPKSMMLASIFFDLNPVHGDESLFVRLQRDMLARTSNNTLFISHMAANALTHRPPLGFFRTFVLIHGGEHDDTFDIKHRGIVPITDIARTLALAEGIHAVNTTERLHAVGKTYSMSREMSENLIDSLEFIANLRIRHQADQIRKQQTPDNFVSPDSLSGLEREHLKDAFLVIKDMQEVLENRYQTGRLR
jgi:CBS domain-containing protein